MTTTKDAIPPPEASSVQECCMCGDHGLSEELLQCRICQFRYQHRYCSNVYPKALSYNICNWCLNQKKNETTNEKTHQNLSSVSSSLLHKKESDQEDRHRKISKRSNSSSTSDGHDHNHHRDDKGPKATIQYPGKILNGGPTKKRMMEPPERSSPPSITKRILRSSGRFDVDDGHKLGMRRAKSETMMIRKKVLIRNKVRRYKLLDEVTS